jgi:hypothetical protein
MSITSSSPITVFLYDLTEGGDEEPIADSTEGDGEKTAN